MTDREKRPRLPMTRRMLLSLFAVAPMLAWPAVRTGEASPPASVPAGGAQPASARLSGLNFSPFTEQQNPSIGNVLDESILRTKLALIAKHTHWIRTYTVSYGMDKVGPAAREHGLRVAMGAWIGRNAAANDREIARLVELARAGHVDIAIVGSETLYRKELDEYELAYYVRRVKRELPTIPVGTADAFGEFLARPALMESVDVLLVNYYPYQQGVGIGDAMSVVHGWHQQVLAAAGGKEVIVSESGWPTGGRQMRDAVPSPENAAAYFGQFVSWAEATQTRYFYFKDFDEPWLALSGHSEDAHWGLWDAGGTLKPDMEPVLAGARTEDVWSARAVPGGPGIPRIEFARMPANGSSARLIGHVWHARPDQHRVAVYLYVGGWWSAPTPPGSVRIQSNGHWSCDITSGLPDSDASVQATRVAAFLVPADFEVPLVTGALELPETLEERSIARLYDRVAFD